MRLDLFFSALIVASAIGCKGDSEPDPDVTPPDFNYIPLNENVCVAYSDEQLAVALTTLTARVESDDWVVAKDFEVCGPTMAAECAACDASPTADNPENYNGLQDFLDSPGQWASAPFLEFLSGELFPSASMEEYFRSALAYPWRNLLVGVNSEAGRLTIGQGVNAECPEGTDGVCNYVSGDSLFGAVPDGCMEDDDVECSSLGCDTFTNEFSAVFTDSDNRYSATGIASSQAFGFVVPLTQQLPQVEDFMSDSAFQQWLGSIPQVAVSLDAPTLQLTDVSTDGAGCGRLVGYLDIATLAQLEFTDLNGDTQSVIRDNDPAVLAPFEDATRPGKIRTILSISTDSITILRPEVPE